MHLLIIINLVPIFVDSPLIKVGFCVFVHKTTSFYIINIHDFCKDKDLEASALRLEFQPTKICIIQIYRSPSGNLQFFLNGLESIIKKLHKLNLHFIICGDININYLIETHKKEQLNNKLISYNYFSMIHLPTRTQNRSNTEIDNIFLFIQLNLIILSILQ
jgi:exonuclease III